MSVTVDVYQLDYLYQSHTYTQISIYICLIDNLSNMLWPWQVVQSSEFIVRHVSVAAMKPNALRPQREPFIRAAPWPLIWPFPLSFHTLPFVSLSVWPRLPSWPDFSSRLSACAPFPPPKHTTQSYHQTQGHSQDFLPLLLYEGDIQVCTSWWYSFCYTFITELSVRKNYKNHLHSSPIGDNTVHRHLGRWHHGSWPPMSQSKTPLLVHISE